MIKEETIRGGIVSIGKIVLTNKKTGNEIKIIFSGPSATIDFDTEEEAVNTIVGILEKENFDLDLDDWIISTYAD